MALVHRHIVRLKQLQRQPADAAAFGTDGNALAREFAEALVSPLTAIKEPDRLVVHAAEGFQFRRLFIRLTGLHAALHESDIDFALLQPGKVFERAGRSFDLERHAILLQDRRVAFGEGIVGPALAAGADGQRARWRWLDELVGHSKTDADDEHDRPGRRQQVANGQQAIAEFRTHDLAHGRRMVLPVVLRASRSRCACAASFSA